MNTPSTDSAESDSTDFQASASDSDPLADIPAISSGHLQIARLFRRVDNWNALLGRLCPGVTVLVPDVEVIARPSGQQRAGIISQLGWPRLGTRVGVGIDTAVAHALVDQLLGYTHRTSEQLRQVSPVEWGILGFINARAILALREIASPFGAWDLTIDRVGPDPFDLRDLGPIFTLRWTLRIGGVTGSLRVWIPASILSRVEESGPRINDDLAARSSLASIWRCEAGTIVLSRGLQRLKPGAIIPLGPTMLSGIASDIRGPVKLECRDINGRSWFAAEVSGQTSKTRLTLTSGLQREPVAPEPLTVDSSPASTSPLAPTDLPVTLTVELGRVSLTLAQLADLKAGDVLELGRHSREPVELTSNGRLVARGEIINIDTELGVRILNVLI